MLNQLLTILAPIIIAVGTGYIWGKIHSDFPSEFVSRLVMNIGTPCLILSAMAKVDVAPSVMSDVALATALAMTLMGLLSWLFLRWQKLDIATYLPPLIFPNNGNMGLPLCLFAFGPTGLALAMGSFMVMMIATFTVGIMIVTPSHGGFSKRVSAIAQQPVIYAMIISVVLLTTKTPLPQWLGNTVDLLGGIAIPLMTIALGVSLATLKIQSWRRSLLFSSLRIGGGLLIGLLACHLLGITGLPRNIVLIQSAMPIAVLNYLLALRYNHNPQEVAAMVVTSTVMAFVGLPFLLMMIL
ncbi:MAG: AEC family transporter [Marinagarivorans sp.]|nr:AEC family transporter [Marinagarivorans sp.]